MQFKGELHFCFFLYHHNQIFKSLAPINFRNLLEYHLCLIYYLKYQLEVLYLKLYSFTESSTFYFIIPKEEFCIAALHIPDNHSKSNLLILCLTFPKRKNHLDEFYFVPCFKILCAKYSRCLAGF
jgi:hypothetical protein